MSGDKSSKRGTPQGGVVSPLVSVVYMDWFLKHLSPTTTIALPRTAPSFATVNGIIHAPSAKPTMKSESRMRFSPPSPRSRGWVE